MPYMSVDRQICWMTAFCRNVFRLMKSWRQMKSNELKIHVTDILLPVRIMNYSNVNRSLLFRVNILYNSFGVVCRSTLVSYYQSYTQLNFDVWIDIWIWLKKYNSLMRRWIPWKCKANDMRASYWKQRKSTLKWNYAQIVLIWI